jgi:predicted regulator of Ras-like GTPase activity (Roadblock/LC7/MglB family)
MVYSPQESSDKGQESQGRAVSWFHEITRIPYIDIALLMDGLGRLVATSNRVGSEAQRVASMIKAAEVLARGLSLELGRGDMNTLQMSTRAGHLLVRPVGTAHYLILLTARNAPLDRVFESVQQLLDGMEDAEISAVLKKPSRSALDDLDVQDLIAAVTDWLNAGGDSTDKGESQP